MALRVGNHLKALGAGKARRGESTHAAPCSQLRFEFLVQQTPYFALEVMQLMAERLRRANSPDCCGIGHDKALRDATRRALRWKSRSDSPKISGPGSGHSALGEVAGD